MGRVTSKAVWGAAIAFWLLIPVDAAGERLGKLDRALRATTTSGESQRVIIRTKAGRTGTVRGKLAKHAGQLAEHRLIDAVTAELSASEIAALAADPDIESISGDHDVNALAKPASTATLPSVLKQTLAIGDWFSGSSITVAVIDSGIAPSVDFTGRIVGFYDFSNGRVAVATTPYDDFGHGTHVAGLIGSSGVSSNGKYSGVAPAVKFLALKVLDRRGTGKTSDVIAALEFAVANKDRFGIKIVNLSLGHPIYESAKTDPLVNAVEAAVRAGLVVVVAAGNYGYNPATGQTGFGGIASPGNSPSAITVGAASTNGTIVRGDDRLSTFSSRGPSWYDGFAKPDILAPGQGLVSNDVTGSTLETEYPGLIVREGTSQYLKLSGSSMATGVVTGLIAAMMEAQQYGSQQRWQNYQSSLPKRQRTSFVAAPRLTSNAVKAMLQYSATPLRDGTGRVYGPLEQGTGLANGYGAIVLAYVTDTTKSVGEYWQTSPLPPSNPIGGVEAVWAQRLIWGTRMLTGGSTVEVKQAAWEEDNIVWGTGEMFNIVWGTVSGEEDNIVWGTVAGEEDNIVWGTTFSPAQDLTWAGNATFEEDNIVWGTALVWDDNLVWGTGLVGYFDGFNIVWGTCTGEEDNIVWGTLEEDNIVWGTISSANRVLTILALANQGS
jgi:serine protease AprX